MKSLFLLSFIMNGSFFLTDSILWWIRIYDNAWLRNYILIIDSDLYKEVSIRLMKFCKIINWEHHKLLMYLNSKSCLKNAPLDNNQLHWIKLAFGGSENCDLKWQAQFYGLYILTRSVMRFTFDGQHTKLQLIVLKKKINKTLITSLVHFINCLSTKVEFQIDVLYRPKFIKIKHKYV